MLNLLHDLGQSQGPAAARRRHRRPAPVSRPRDQPRAARIAEMVLWIGYLQWHFRTHGSVQPPQPVLHDFRNIENRDALITYTRRELVRDAAGRPLTRWDGVTTKPSPVTGEPVPDESAQIEQYRYVSRQRPPGRRPTTSSAIHVSSVPPPCAERSATATSKPCAAHLESARVSGFRHALVAQCRRAVACRARPALQFHHHKQYQTDLQPPRGAGAARRQEPADARLRHPDHPGSTPPTARQCGSDDGGDGGSSGRRSLAPSRQESKETGENEVESISRRARRKAVRRLEDRRGYRCQTHFANGNQFAASNFMARALSSPPEEAQRLGLGSIVGLENHPRLS